MSAIGGPNIIEDGLVLYVDAANPKSYPSQGLDIEYLIVAGGGGGGSGSGGNAGGSGGGAGGLTFGKMTLSLTQFSVIVGAGGGGVPAGSNTSAIGGVGGNSSLNLIVSNGGGGGASYNTTDKVNGMNGGSGAGGHPRTTPYSTGYGFGTEGQGNDGGKIIAGSGNFGGGLGGGGAGLPGQDGQAFSSSGVRPGSDGGDGLSFASLFGILVGDDGWFSGGGGGGGASNSATLSIGGNGGKGGGGNGGNWSTNTAATSGLTNSGGGGGGGAARGSSNNAGQNGGSGIVIIRYQGPQRASGGTVTSVDGWVIHTFTASGTFDVGGVWGDVSRNGNNGTLVNGPTFDSGNLGSLVFDGVDDYVTVGNTITNSDFPNNNYTLSCWFNWNGTVGGNDGRAYLLQNGGSRYPLTLEINSRDFTPARFATWEDTSNGDAHRNSNVVVDTNRWYYFVVSKGISNTIKMFVDGNEIFSTTSIGGNLREFSGIRIATYRAFNNRWFGGNISQTKIYNRALTAAEILQNYNATKGRYGL